MATIDVKVGGDAVVGHPSGRGLANAYNFSYLVKGADVAVAKGSALAAADVIQITDIPAESVVNFCALEVTTAETGTALTADLGDAADPDRYVDDADLTVVAFSAPGTGGTFAPHAQNTATEVLALTLVTVTAANDDWVIRVYGQMSDISGNPEALAAKDVPIGQ